MPRKKRRSRLNRLRRIVRLAALNRVFRTNVELLSLGFLNYVHFLDLENECSQRTTNQRANYVQSTVFDRAFRATHELVDYIRADINCWIESSARDPAASESSNNDCKPDCQAVERVVLGSVGGSSARYEKPHSGHWPTCPQRRRFFGLYFTQPHSAHSVREILERPASQFGQVPATVWPMLPDSRLSLRYSKAASSEPVFLSNNLQVMTP